VEEERKKRKGIPWGCFALPYFMLAFIIDGAIFFGRPRSGFIFFALAVELVIYLIVVWWLDKKGWIRPSSQYPFPPLGPCP